MDNVSLERLTGASYFNREMAARALNMTIQRLGYLLRSGRFPGAIQINERGDWRIPAEDILAFTRRKAGRPAKAKIA